KIQSVTEENGMYFFTIYIGKIWVKYNTQRKDLGQTGEVLLNDNSIKMVSNFYSFFTNLEDKDVFSTSRMTGMSDYYQCQDFSFRTELFYTNNERRGSSKFTVMKHPGLIFSCSKGDYKEIQRKVSIVCSFLSFCYGIRIYPKRIKFYEKEDLYIF